MFNKLAPSMFEKIQFSNILAPPPVNIIGVVNKSLYPKSFKGICILTLIYSSIKLSIVAFISSGNFSYLPNSISTSELL